MPPSKDDQLQAGPLAGNAVGLARDLLDLCGVGRIQGAPVRGQAGRFPFHLRGETSSAQGVLQLVE